MGHGRCRNVSSPPSLRVIRRWIAAGLALLAPFVSAQAAPIEFHYGGVITSADAGTGVTVGDRFDGTFTYDPQTNPLYMAIENAHYYEFGTSINWPAPPAPDTSAMSLSIGGKPMMSQQGGLNLGISEVDSDDRYNPYPRTVVELRALNGFTINLTNPQRGVFGSVEIPTAINLADFPDATIAGSRWDAASGTYLSYRGTIDTLSQVNVTTTPEPASVALWLGLAASAWGIRARMRSRT